VAEQQQAQQIVESGNRLAQQAGAHTREVIAEHQAASRAMRDVADKIQLTAALIKMAVAERRAELEAASDPQEAGPH
jgi:hypothetical protein